MLETKFKGNVGLFLVCAELSKRNLIAMPTSRNTKGFDVVAFNPKTKKSRAIQVKCSDKGNKQGFPVCTSHWRDYEDKVEETLLTDFVFVDLSDDIDKPTYYVLSEEETKST